MSDYKVGTRLATSRPLGERSEPFLTAKGLTASDEVARGRNPTKHFFESLGRDLKDRAPKWEMNCCVRCFPLVPRNLNHNLVLCTTNNCCECVHSSI